MLRHRIAGQVVKEIAETEQLTERKVRFYLWNVKRKLFQSNDLLNAAVMASRTGLLDVIWKEEGEEEENPLLPSSLIDVLFNRQ